MSATYAGGQGSGANKRLAIAPEAASLGEGGWVFESKVSLLLEPKWHQCNVTMIPRHVRFRPHTADYTPISLSTSTQMHLQGKHDM